ncbi:MAG: hypothetical protein E7532_04620 [Ruminococcaceae bacterium]|nr:hypothetical protein [Oscillospiraceae bacterium]
MIQKNRLYYLDVLRIISSIFVIVIHICILNWGILSPNSLSWQALNIFDALSQIAVPIFFMISGALFLDDKKEISIKNIFFKRIFKLLVAYLVWSVVFVLINPASSWSNAIYRVIQGHYHMWFIPALAGVYIIIPFLKAITKSEKLTKYFLILSVLFTFTLSFISPILKESSVGVFALIGNLLNILRTKLIFRFTLGYSGYFVFGYFLNKTEFSKSMRRIIYIMGIAAALATICFSYLISKSKGTPTDTFYSNTSLNILISSVAFFVFAKYNLNCNNIKEKSHSKLVFLSKCTFGVYLIHPIFIELINKHLHINAVTVNPLLAVPLFTLTVAVLSYISSIILNKIPLIRKYIV